MKKSSKITFKQKQEAVDLLFKQYDRAKVKLYCLENTSFYPQVGNCVLKENRKQYCTSIASRFNQIIDDKDELKSLIESFEIVIRALSPESQLIINNEYVKKRSHDWWAGYYSRATYYRLKTRALEEILFYVNIS